MSKVVAPFLFLAIAAGLIFSYTKPAYESLQTLQVQDENLLKTISDADDLQEKQKGLWDTYLGFRATDLKRLNMILPDTIDAVRLIIDVDAIASQYDVKILEFQVPVAQGAAPNARGGAAVTTSLGTASFTLGGEGSYSNVKAFLTDLETNLSLLDVSNLTVVNSRKAKDEETEVDTQEFTVSLNTYWLR